MKANRKFVSEESDEAVSPVIAVILMVAITVVLAATVYVWVSGFGSQSSQPAKTLSLSSNGALSDGFKNYTIASATPGMKWSDLKITVDGAEMTQAASGACATTHQSASQWVACSAGNVEAGTAVIDAGDTLKVYGSAGQTLRILDSQANSVILTLAIG